MTILRGAIKGLARRECKLTKTQSLYQQKLSVLDTFVVASVLTILGIRLFLEITGYPQIGGNGLHIAHVLWGGVGLTVTVLLLLLVEKPNKQFISFVAGISFGFLIDEIGKFVTSDNNYFFRPSAFLMYLIILFIWLIARVMIVRRSGGVFLSAAEWPKEKHFRWAVLVWVLVNIATGLIAIVTALLEGINILGFTNEFSEFMPTLIAITTVIHVVGLVEYVMKKIAQSARTIRLGALVSAVAVYPFIFYGEQFSAAIGCLITVVVVVALSESSLKQILGPILTFFRRVE